jgi:hypothetical protein
MSIKSGLASALFFLCFTITVQAQKLERPVEYNDYLSSATDTLSMLGTKWGARFSEVKEKKEFEKLIPVRKEIQSFISRKKMEYFLLKDLKGSEQLRLAMIEFLFFQDYLIGQGFVPFESLGKTTTDTVIDDYVKKLMTLSEGEGPMLQKVIKEQEAYAAKNGFTLGD